MKNHFTFAFAFVVLFCVILLYYSGYKNRNDWSHQIQHYQQISDSLAQVVTSMHSNVKEKDSLLLLYMASLDKTLEELNKEAKKNASVISMNATLQDSLIRTYCRDMAKLNQRPDLCKK